MTFKPSFGTVLAALAALFPIMASAEPAPSSPPAQTLASPSKQPDVATLLFGTPMWALAPAGAKIRYTFEKTVSDASLGSPFKDDVVLSIGPGDDAKSRTVEMQLFSGTNRRPAGPFRSDEQNPVLLVVLENNVQELSKLFKANPRYLKNAIRKAWRDDPHIEQAADMIDGASTPVTRITITPFLNDNEADRMLGLQTLAYQVDVSDKVPGYIAAIDIRAPAQNKTLFSETLRYSSETKP